MLEIYRQPVADASAVFGWRYTRSVVLGPDSVAAPLAAPDAGILVADLLP